MTHRVLMARTRLVSRSQRGVISTLLAIIVLLATLLAALALMRSIDTSNTVAGTLAFRQSVSQEAELAYQKAVSDQFLYANGAGVGEADNAGIGYYASIQPVDSRGIPVGLTNGSQGTQLANSAAVVDKVYYMIERLCPTSGPPLVVAPNPCLVPAATVTGGSSTGNQGGFAVAASAGYRLTIRVDGPKSSQSYVQTVLR